MCKREYQQCVRCVMDTTDPEIQFDSNGVCNNCIEFLKKREEVKANKKYGSEHLAKIVEKIKSSGRQRKYDVLLGISGGVDSCYVAYLLKQLGLRVLLLHLDNGWNSNYATQNIRNAARIFGFDYQSYVLDWEEFKDIQLAFLKASVVEAETPTDVAILGAMHRVAAKYGIKYIISGGNLNFEGILPKLWHYNAKDTVYFNHIQRAFGTKKVRKFPSFGFEEETYFKLVKGIRIIYFLNYVDFNKDRAKEILEREIDWKDYGGKHHESHFTKFIQSYLLPRKFDLDYRKASLSSLICAGQITREEALRILKLPPYKENEIERDKEYIAKKLGIEIQELNRIIELPGKYYYEYPNDEKRLTFIYNTYKRLFN
jgi:N-acetyl sugar amidotransferase